MFWSDMRRSLLPQSLRTQFMLAVGGLALLILAGGVTAVYALRTVSISTQQLAEKRLVRMQQAQDMVRLTLLIERESYQLANTESVERIRASYADIVGELHELDVLVDSIAVAGDDVTVLDLHQANQLFRNTANILAQLREDEMQTGSRKKFNREFGHSSEPAFNNELRQQAGAMVSAAQLQFERFTQEYRREVKELAQTALRNQRWVTVLLAGSLLLAWLLALQFLGKHVLARLQLVSRNLRQSGTGDEPPELAVQGNDEISEMARAVEQFKKDRKQLAQRTTQLEAANKELDEFSYSMSHDMRTPLRALDGFSKILLDEYGGKLDDDGKRLLNVVRDNAKHMGRQMDDILRFLYLGRQKIEYVAVDVAELATKIFAELQFDAPARRMHLNVGTLPMAWGDRSMIRQILRELFLNACKFSFPDSAVDVEVGGSSDANGTHYYVKNLGVGFDMRYVDKLFRVFERVHTTGQYEGTGIGLAVVKRIVERHGGKVWAEGQVGEGATFHFSLPHRQ
jgi:signal transduction histidine kinase